MNANENETKNLEKEGKIESVEADVVTTEKSVAKKTKAKKAPAKKTTTKTSTKGTVKKEAEKPTEAATEIEEKPVVKKTRKPPIKTDAVLEKTTAAKSVKTVPEKVTSKKVEEKELSISIFIQCNGKEVEQQEIIERIKADWAQKGNDLKDITTLETYIKPEENMIYYVINSIPNSGKIEF